MSMPAMELDPVQEMEAAKLAWFDSVGTPDQSRAYRSFRNLFNRCFDQGLITKPEAFQ